MPWDDLPRVMSLLSHELRAPVGVVRGYLRMLDGSELTDRQRQAIAAALRASERAAELLNQASLLAHLRLGDIPLDRRRIALVSLLNTAVHAVELPEESPVSLDVGVMPAVTILGDENRLRVALSSLVAAVARAQTSVVAVEITATKSRLRQHAAVRLRIGPRTLSRVRARETLPDLTRGGMGLAFPIAVAILEMHRGKVRELRHGDSSTGLVVWLPVAR